MKNSNMITSFFTNKDTTNNNKSDDIDSNDINNNNYVNEMENK